MPFIQTNWLSLIFLLHLFLDSAFSLDQTPHILIETIPSSLLWITLFLFHRPLSSYSIWPNQHHPYIQHVQTVIIYLSSPNKEFSDLSISFLSFRPATHYSATLYVQNLQHFTNSFLLRDIHVFNSLCTCYVRKQLTSKSEKAGTSYRLIYQKHCGW